MEEAKAVGSEAGDVLVVNEVLALEFEVIIFFPVAANRQNVIRAFNHCNDVRQQDACRVTVLVQVFVAFKVQINVALVQGEPLVVQVAEASLFVLGFLNIGLRTAGLTQLNVSIEPCGLQFDDLVLGLAHDVRDAIASVHVCRTVGEQHVFGWHKNRHLTSQTGVKIHLFER